MMKKRKWCKCMVVCLLAVSMSITVNATSISDLKQQKEEKESKKEEAEAVLGQLQAEQKSILGAIEKLDAQVASYNEQITQLQEEQTKLEGDIEVQKGELAQAEAEEDAQYEAMKQRIKYAYENGNISYLDTVFSTADISDIVNQAEYVDQIYTYDSEMLDTLVEIRKRVADKKKELEEK